MATTVTPNGRPVPFGASVTERYFADACETDEIPITYSRITYREVERGSANVYRHNDDTFVIEGLTCDEASRLMVLLLHNPGFTYLGAALGRSLFPDMEEVTQ